MKIILSKKVFTLFALFFNLLVALAQAPQGFSYQAVIRNGSGAPIVDQFVGVEITLQNTLGTALFTETHRPKTNAQGVISITIGEGTLMGTNTFASIPWKTGDVLVKVRIDPAGETDYAQIGELTELKSVPYALYANPKEITSAPGADPNAAIFEVKNTLGQVVFGVYQSGVRVFVENAPVKGAKGGFAIGGLSQTKAEPDEYFKIYPDSARVYVKHVAKGAKGGFAIGGLSQTKAGSTNDYFNISGNSELGTIGSEARILWYPVKAAFLAGEVHIGSADSVGKNSTSLGYRTIAMGNYSQAMGYKAQSLGLNSTAIGNSAIAKSNNSFAFGNNAQTQGLNSFAFGDSAISNGDDSYAMGSHAKALGKNSFAMGSFGFDAVGLLAGPPVASGDYSYAFGIGSQASGLLSFAFGNSNIATNNYSIAMGDGNTSTAGGSIAIGRHNNATGPASTALGNYTNASGVFSTTFGNATSASGLNATAMGFETAAIGDYSMAIGRKIWAWKNHSIAIGSFITANGEGALALGNYTYASGSYSTVIGYKAKANSYASMVVGRYNDTTSTSSTAWVSTDPLFIIGNGSADDARSNALTVLKDGRIGIGTKAPDKKLHVEGDARIEGDIYYGVSGSTTKYTKPDFVFLSEYSSYFEPLKVDEFIKANGHLPWLTKASNEKEGINLTRMQFETLETVENLQLQIIELKKEHQNKLSKQQSEIDNLKAELEAIKAMLKK